MARSVIVIVNEYGDSCLNSKQICFYMAWIGLGRVCINLTSLLVWATSMTDETLNLDNEPVYVKENSELYPVKLSLKIDLMFHLLMQRVL